jgi:peroxiredoxin
LRQDYDEFRRRDAEVVAVGPDGPRAFLRYWADEQLPFAGCPDPKHEVADLYGQKVNWLKLGRMPALVIVDKAGQIRYSHYGQSMQDIPANVEVLAALDHLNEAIESQITHAE